MPYELVWALVIIGAIICGSSAAILWVAQGSYTSHVSDEYCKAQLFGLFWALMMSSQIIGNLLITFVLGKMNNLTYFILLTSLGCNCPFKHSFKLSFIFIFT